VINVHVSGITTPKSTESHVRGIGSHGFWMLFALEGMFVAAALLVVLNLLLPPQAPLTQSADYSIVREAIWSRLNGAVSDPLIEITPSVTVRSSSVRGFTLNGQTYYYYLEGQRGFDPLSRGAVSKRDIEVVLRDDGSSNALIIYRLTR
jgi:hypothetical protein